MRNVMSIVAIVMTLVGSANFAMAQSVEGNGVVTGTISNAEANQNNGEYVHHGK